VNNQLVLQLVIAGTFILTLFALFLIAVLIVHKNKQNKFYAEKAIQNYRHQNQILAVRLEAQEDVMTQISRELHDNISQLLGLTQVNIHLLADKTEEPEAKRLAGTIQGLISQVQSDLQNLSHSLNGTFINNLGLTEALTKEVEYINAARRMKCDLQIDGALPELTPERELLLFRIAQEAVHNALKHSGATELSIYLGSRDNKLHLSIRDNGGGFDTSDSGSSGIGMVNMQQRASSLQGRLLVESAPGRGTSVSVVIEI